MSTQIDPNLYLSTYQKQQRKTGSDILGKDDFLKILMTQLQNQDPLNPMKDKDFIAQMATFSSLEQMTNMNSTMERFINSQTDDSLVKYSNLIGKSVEWSKTIEVDGVTTVSKGSGLVASISKKGTETQLELKDGTVIGNNDITVIKEAEDN